MELLENCPEILTIADAAKILRISRPTMQKLVADEKINYAKIINKTLILKAFLIEFLEKSYKMCYNQNIAVHAPANQEQPHLDNCMELVCTPSSEGDSEMATKINQPVMINGSKLWIRANTMAL